MSRSLFSFFILILWLCGNLWASEPKVPVAALWDVPLVDTQGQSLKLDQFKGQWVLVNFWATWCPPCIEELPSMDALNQRFKAKAFTLIAISVDESSEDVERFLTSLNRPPSFLVARDPSAQLAKLWGTEKYPESFLIGPDGQLVEKFVGAVLWTAPDLVKRISGLIEGKLE